MGRCTSDGVYSLYSVAGIDLDSRDRVDIKVHAKTLGQGSIIEIPMFWGDAKGIGR